MAAKTNACRLLDASTIPYTILEYKNDDNELDAISVARKINLPPDQVFKTLVLTGDVLRYFVVVIPGNTELDLKKTARLTGNTSCALLPLQQLQPLTGYIRGGCSPIGMKKQFPTFLDETAWLFDRISISPGARGMQILIAPDDLVKATSAMVIAL